MKFQEKAAHAELYKKLKDKQKENNPIKKTCDLYFYQSRKEMQSKIYRFGKYLESNYELESSTFIQTWFSLNCSKRTKTLRRDGIYQQYEYPQNFRNLEDYLIKLTIFEDPSPWFWRITEQFRKNVVIISDIDDILTVMQLTLKGFFQEGNIRVTKTIPLSYDRYQCCFTQQFKQKFIILFEVVVEIYPLFNQINQYQGTEIKHTMIFYNILSYDIYSEQKAIDITNRYLDNLSKYHRDEKFLGNANGVYRECYQKELFSHYAYGNYFMQDINIVGKIIYTCSEFLYKHRNVPKDKLNQYKYDDAIGAWVCLELDDPLLKKIQLQQWINEFLYKFDSILPNGQLIKLLEIPSLNIEMTRQEKNIIGAQGNLLVMGRSGTGKTTCAILRLFGLQLLFHQRMSNLKIRNKEFFDSKRITQDDLDEMGLKCVFVTSSPVLANQVKKYYQSLNDKLVSRKNQNNEDGKEQSECPLSEDYKHEEDEDKLIADINQYDSFDDMSPKDFPAFFTIRKLIQIIDGSLSNPFFAKYKNYKKRENTQLLSNWHNQNHRVVRPDNIQTDLNSDDDQKIESDIKIDKPLLYDRKLISSEVTYEAFETKFWPTLKIYSSKIKGITPGLLWTHINSYIKGSALSHSSWKPYLNTWSYYKLKPKLMLKKSMMKQIYELFVQYEEWKTENDYYDLMDAVNYILIQIKNAKTQFHKIHYLMVDEVQDLPDNILLLLLRVTQFGTVFSGDTAQNIAKGVGFRFQDLNSLFIQYDCEHDLDELKKDQFKRYQLTINFRSHNNILQLANSIISVLELCFPQTIDILEKEKSNLMGPKPIIIYSQETLFMILNCNKEEPLKFGCNQVIIVKDQESKERIPQILKHALILTIQEAKGLEFNDVILYNFFNDTSDQWSILEKLSQENQLVDIKEFKNTISLHNQGVDYDENIYGYSKIDDKYLIKKIKFNKKSQKFNPQQHSILCNYLKYLYVAITRAKNRFIIYDDDSSNREGLQNIWNQLQLVDIYNKNDIPQVLQNQLEQISKQDWHQQGKMLFENKFYLQSMKCFELSGDDYWYSKANAYYLAGEGTIQLSQFEINDKNDKNVMKKTDIEKQYKQLFRNASKIFLEINNPIQAAKCLYSAGDYQEALQIYEAQGWIKEAAEAANKSKLYKKAGDLFFQINDYASALDAYEIALDQDGLYKTLINIKNKFDPNIEINYEKYLYIVLKSIEDKLDDGKKREPQNIILQKENMKSFEEIDKNSEYSIINNFYFKAHLDQSDQFNTIQIDQSQNYTQSLPGSNEQIKFNIDQQQNHTKQQPGIYEQIQLISQNENDFSIISQENSSNHLEQNPNQRANFINEFSNDFEDLQNKQDLLILEGNSSLVSIKSQFMTDLSIISSNLINDTTIQLEEIGYNELQDLVLEQIIKWLSIFSDEFQSYQIQQKSKIDVGELQQNLYQIDLELVKLILTILEQFKLFKLCIFVCKRKKLANESSRFITLIAAQNSPIIKNPSQLLRGSQYELNKLKQMGIEASKAINSLLSKVNKDFFLQQHQLHTQLIMLGYWKQTAYQLSFDDAQLIFRVFQDFKTWKSLYFKNLTIQLQIQFNNEQNKLIRNNIQGRLLVSQKKLQVCYNSHPQDLFYFDFPNEEEEKQFTINNLKHIYVELNSENKSLKKIKLPQCLVNTEIIWNSIQYDNSIPEGVILQVCSNFNNYTQIFQLHQSILFLITYVKHVYHYQNSNISQQYSMYYSNKTIIQIRDCLQLIIDSIKSNILSQKQQIIFDSILLLNKISLPKGELFKHFQQYLIVRRDSKILERLNKKKENQRQKKCYFIDIDFEFLIAPKEDVIQIVLKQFKSQIQSLFSLRLQIYPSCYDRDEKIESLGIIIANRYNNSQDLKYLSNSQSQQVQNNPKLLLYYEENTSNNALVNEFISQIMNSNNYCQRIEPTVKVKLLEIAISYINQSKFQINESHNKIIKGIILLNFTQKNYYSYLFIDQISQINQEYKYYHKYMEYLICRKYNIITDASECYFEYYDNFKAILNVDEILCDLTFIFVHQLIILKQKVYLPQLLINCINQPQDTKIKIPIYPSNEQQLNFTIQCLIENFNQLILFAPQQILLIITSYVLNIDVIPSEIISQLEDLRNKQIQFIVDNIKYQTDIRIQNLCPNLKLQFLDNQDVLEISVENTLNHQQLHDRYQECMNEWEFIVNQQKNLNKIANKISKYWNQYKQKSFFFNCKQFENFSGIPKNEQVWTKKVYNKIKSIKINLIENIYTLQQVEFPLIYQKLEELYLQEEQYIKFLENHKNNKFIENQVLYELLSKQIDELGILEILQQRQKFKENKDQNI